LIGLVWGLWHAPGVLLGHNFPDYPLLGAFMLMPLVTILFSIAFGTVYQRNRLIWIPALFHGSVNMSAEMSTVALIDGSLNRPLNDLIWIGLWGISALVFWRTRKHRSPDKMPRTKVEPAELGNALPRQ
jgi:membrane protease YdiL (CAAX protease family)